jgi:hypothetical protein
MMAAGTLTRWMHEPEALIETLVAEQRGVA